MTEQEDHFKRAEKISYEALSIAIQKAETTIQEKDQEIERLKSFISGIVTASQNFDLSPAKKEETFNWKK